MFELVNVKEQRQRTGTESFRVMQQFSILSVLQTNSEKNQALLLESEHRAGELWMKVLQ